MSAGRRLPSTPEPMHTWVGAGGVALAGDAWGPADGRVVVLLHGGGQTRHAWRGTGRVLGDAGYRAVALDARGHGDSDWAADGDYEYDTMVDDLVAVVDQLGGASPVLVGASMGGGVALLAAGTDRFDVGALVLVDVTPRLEPSGVANILAFMDRDVDGFESLDAVAAAIEAYQPQRERVRRLDGLAKNVRLGDDGRYRWHWDPRFLDVRRDQEARALRLEACARRLTVPTLLVRGGLSDVVSEAGAAAFLAICSHAEYINVPSAAHMVAGDRNDVFSDAVVEFLRRTAPVRDLRGALDQASVPTLLLCLAHLTGDTRWFEPRYRPRRDTALFADESGGLPPEVQEEIKTAIVDVLAAVESGALAVPAPPDEAAMVELMRLCVGEDVPPEYAPVALEDLGFRDRDVHWTNGRPPAADAFEVLVIGAGLSGIAASVKLAALGIHHEVVERNAGVGGTWWDNRYPESGVDTPNHFYSFSFAPNSGWTGYFSKQPEVLGYLDGVVDRFGVRERISFSTEVVSMRWVDGDARWEVHLRGADGSERVVRPNAVITATGQMNRPKIQPREIERFDGPWFHSAQWRDDVDLDGKRVAVVGVGASAMQLLRTVAARAAHVTVFQRSPQWVRPNPDYHREVAPATQWLMQHVPGYAAWYRFGLFWRFGDGLLRTLRRDPEWPHPERAVNRHNDRHRLQMTEYLEAQLADRPDLLDACLPDYPPYGKRILVDNDWYATLRRENVTLVPEGVTTVDRRTLVAADGSRHEVDVVILATGFESGKLLFPIDIVGRGGARLAEVWADDDPRAYLGIAVPDFPNLFCLYGPNTNLGHGGSIMFQAECQVRYVTDLLRQQIEGGIAAVEVRRDVHDDYNARIDAEHEHLVWTHPGMTTWFRNAQGRVISVQPWRLVDYWEMTHDAHLGDYEVVERNDKGDTGSDD